MICSIIQLIQQLEKYCVWDWWKQILKMQQWTCFILKVIDYNARVNVKHSPKVPQWQAEE